MIEPQIYTALSSYFSGRVYPDTVPADTAYPFCIYQQIGGVPVSAVCGDSTQQNARIQFWVWCAAPPGGGGRAQANSLMREIAIVLAASPLYGTSQGALIAQYDDVTRSYGAMQDFSFWFVPAFDSGG